MPITQTEFNVIKDVVKHVINARRIALSKKLEGNSNHEMGRIFDPGTGLRYMLLDIVKQDEQDDSEDLYFKIDLLQHGINVGGAPGAQLTDLSVIQQSEVSKYYELFILPKSVRDNLDNFYKDISDSDLDLVSDDKIKAHQCDDSESDSDDKKRLHEYTRRIVKEFRYRVLEPIYNELVEFYGTEIRSGNPLFRCVSAQEMSRYTLTGLLMNTVSLTHEIDKFRTILNKSISRFLAEKLKAEHELREQATTARTETLILRKPVLRRPLVITAPSLPLEQAIKASTNTSTLRETAVPRRPIITPGLPSKTFFSAKILNDLEESYKHNSKLYTEARRRRKISFFRDCIGIKQSYITQWFFSVEKNLSSNKTPDEKIAQIIESYKKLNKNENLIIQLKKRYQAINNFCQKLEESEGELKKQSFNPMLRRATV